MSYELYFTQKSPEKISHEALDAFFQEDELWAIDVEESATINIKYHNDLTQTTFHIRIIDNDPSEQEDGGFYFSGILMSLSYARPTYFAYESMIVVKEMADHFDLYVIDAQDHVIGGNGSPKKVEADELTRSWEKNNEREVLARANAGEDFAYLSEEKAMQVWQYMLGKQKITDTLGPAYRVSGYALFQTQDSNELELVTEWEDGKPTVFAPCDYILINDQLEYITYHKLREVLEDYLEEINIPIEGVLAFDEKHQSKVQKIFQSLEPSGTLSDAMFVPFSHCVSVEGLPSVSSVSIQDEALEVNEQSETEADEEYRQVEDETDDAYVRDDDEWVLEEDEEAEDVDQRDEYGLENEEEVDEDQDVYEDEMEDSSAIDETVEDAPNKKGNAFNSWIANKREHISVDQSQEKSQEKSENHNDVHSQKQNQGTPGTQTNAKNKKKSSKFSLLDKVGAGGKQDQEPVTETAATRDVYVSPFAQQEKQTQREYHVSQDYQSYSSHAQGSTWNSSKKKGYLDEESFKYDEKKLKTYTLTRFAMMFITMLLVYLILNTSVKHALFGNALVLGVLFFLPCTMVLMARLKKEKSILQSFKLIVTDEEVKAIYELPTKKEKKTKKKKQPLRSYQVSQVGQFKQNKQNTEEILITRDEIDKVLVTDRGGLRVYSQYLLKTIEVLPELKGFDIAKASINELCEVKSKPKSLDSSTRVMIGCVALIIGIIMLYFMRESVLYTACIYGGSIIAIAGGIYVSFNKKIYSGVKKPLWKWIGVYVLVMIWLIIYPFITAVI
ncbi:hypothetical protein [Caldalkalibacillus salinus]|uniref:hypothetical protein n=1 Tax=Caldalkalibacillus salinus TaxID=2803787 RepID=UPI001923ECBF|nr:hypothetical protein [Caldalkalibacillus salinus]